MIGFTPYNACRLWKLDLVISVNPMVRFGNRAYCDVPVNLTQKKGGQGGGGKSGSNFWVPTCHPTTPPNPLLHHSFSLIPHSLWPAPHFSLLLFSFFFFFFIFGRTLLFTRSNSPAGTSVSPFLPSFFRQDHRKILENP